MNGKWTPRTAAVAARGAVVTLALSLLAAAASAPAAAQQVRFSTENDLLGGETADDLFTFSVALELERGLWDWSLREDAFTDRAAGVRFDQTYLGIGRDFAGARPWSFHVEAGLVRLGRGLFGEDAQNAVHRAIGGDEVDLRYLDTSLHGRAAVAAERTWQPGEGLELGPRFEVELVPGVASKALAGVAVRWRPGPRWAVEALAGGRWADPALAELEPHLSEQGPAARLGLIFDDRIFVAWSYNDHGDEREHLSAGWRLGLGGRGREEGVRRR